MRFAALLVLLATPPFAVAFAPPSHLPATPNARFHGVRPRCTAATIPSRTTPTALAAAALPMGLEPKVLKAAVGAVGQLIVTTGVGATTVKTGLLNKAQISALAGIVYNVFLPCFLFCSVIQTVSTYGVSPSLLAMPFAAFTQIGLGMLLARTVILPVTGLDKSSANGRELSLCTTFGNPAVLPLLFFDALFRSPYPDVSILPKLAAYNSFYMMGFSPLFWAIGKAIMTSGDATDEACLLAGDLDKCEGESALVKVRKAIVAFVKPPPVAGALLGLLVATTFLKGLMIGPGAPFKTVYMTLQKFGSSYLPSASLVLAGSLASGVGQKDDGAAESTTAAAADDGGGGGLQQRIAAIAVARFLLLPLIGSASLFGLSKVGLIPTVAANPVLWFFLLTQFSMPPAQNSVVMLQVMGQQPAATRLSRTLFLTYTLSAIPLTALFSVFMTVCKL